MAARGGWFAARLAPAADRLLRLLGDPRLAIALLLAAGAWNAVAAAAPDGPRLLDGAPYGVLLGAILLSGLAAVVVRAPIAWREWRRPAPLPPSPDQLSAVLERPGPMTAADRDAVVRAMRSAGYRVREHGAEGRWATAGVRRGWSRFLGLASHLALVVVLVGATMSTAFSAERTFSLTPGSQAFLSDPGPGRTEALELIGFDPAFGADGRPLRLDVEVAFLRDGQRVETRTLRVNEPGAFGGLLVHGWTYGPAANIRVTTVAGRPVWDAAVPLDGSLGERAAGIAELRAVATSLGVVLADADANALSVGVATNSGGLLDAVVIEPGESLRVGSLLVSHEGLTSYVTFLARRDPGAPVLFGGAAALVGSLAGALWLPRRRATVRMVPDGLAVAVRGERFDRPDGELARLERRIALALPPRA